MAADTVVRARIDAATEDLVPNAATRAALAELEAGKGQRFADVDALMTDLNADDRTIHPVQAGLQTAEIQPSPSS
jgi:hypothetical protein